MKQQPSPSIPTPSPHPFFFPLLTTLAVIITAAPPATPPVAALTYVESSTGLGTPALDGGRTEVEMADVNADGKLDLISIGDHGSPYVNTQEHGIMVWFGDGAGNWSVVQTGNFGYGGVALGDVNGDGHLDAAYGMHHNYSGVDFGDQLLEVALGDGTGTAWTPWDDGLATHGETWGMFGTDLADFDADGDLDVAANSFGCCAGVHVYLNQGDGTWLQSFGFVGGNSRQDLTTGDVNGDGYPDIAVAHQNQTVYLGDGSGGFTAGDGNLPPAGSVGRRGPSLGDIDADGRADLAFATSQGGVEVWRWTGPGTWAAAGTGLPASGNYEATQLFDMDLDGAMDLVAFGDGQLTIWTGDGSGNWTQSAALNSPTPGYHTALRTGGDTDHNGFPDIAVIAQEGGPFVYVNRFHLYREATPPTTLAIHAMQPRPAATLRAGAVAFIDWTSSVPGSTPATVTLELSTSGAGGPWTMIASGLPDSGRWQWTVPFTVSADCRLRYTLAAGTETALTITPSSFAIVGDAAAIALDPAAPLARPLELSASPNPFASETTITWNAGPPPADGAARIGIYDPAGRMVRLLIPEAGAQDARWDGRDSAGHRVPPGAYFIRLEGSDLRALARGQVIRTR